MGLHRSFINVLCLCTFPWRREDGWLQASCGFIPLAEDSAGSWCFWGMQSRLHGVTGEVGYELTPTWTFLLVEKISFLWLCGCLGFILCAVQGTRIYSSALKRRCSSSQSRAALAEGLPALWHTNCPNGGSSALPCAPTPPAVPRRWRELGGMQESLVVPQLYS